MDIQRKIIFSVCIWKWCLCLSAHWEWEKSMLLLCLGPFDTLRRYQNPRSMIIVVRLSSYCWWNTRCPALSRKVSLPSMLVKFWRVSWLHKLLRLCTGCRHITHFASPLHSKKYRADCVCQACVGVSNSWQARWESTFQLNTKVPRPFPSSCWWCNAPSAAVGKGSVTRLGL